MSGGILDQRPRADRRPEPAGEPGHLHVVRHHRDDLVARLDQRGERDQVRFRSAVGHQHVRRRGAIHRRDQRSKLRRPVGLRVDQILMQQRGAIGLRFQQFLDAQRMHAALREIPGDLVLPD
jgi:hypothetical protein